ncbi:MAG TPA: MtrB/PioB family outer membrane beta-barrel protein [Thermodesulfobacteriota bacterium]|nr:MtrB/PioB family outer membrane beta-barrel protein [Thermodesulfobacteriota bacterium]
MKTKIIIFALMTCVIPGFNAFSEDLTIEGELAGTGEYIGVTGEGGGKAKFTEYRDLKEHGGFYGRGRFDLDAPDYFLRFNMTDPGYTDQYYDLEGGMYGKFKLDLFFDEIPHNVTFDAKTFFLGAGHDVLVGTPNANVATWNTFDYSTERKIYGGSLKFDMFKPFFFDVSYTSEKKDGIKPAGVFDFDTFGSLFEIPEPVSYLTNQVNLSAGYSQNPLFLSFNYFYSRFNNSNTYLFIDPAALTAPDNLLSLPNDNDFYKLAFKGAIKLPFNTRFSTNISYGKGTSETTFVPSYDGKVKRYNYDVILTSNPIRCLDAKFYYKYYKWDNKSDVDPAVVEPSFFTYRTATYGTDFGLRLPYRFYFTAGYKYVDTKRSFHQAPGEELPDNKDNIFYTELKWNGLDFMDLRVGYERMDRQTIWPNLIAHYTPDNPARMFAYQAQDMNAFNAYIDVYPIDNLNIGFGYKYKKSNYEGDGVAGGVAGPGFFGLKKDQRNDFNFSIDYVIGKIAKVFGYFDFEKIKLYQDQFSLEVGAPWQVDQRDITYGFGIGADIYVIPNKLTFKFLCNYVNANGAADYSLDPATFGLTGLPINLNQWDDYTKYGIGFKAIYTVTKNLTSWVGYAFERFKYSDDQLNNYQYVFADSFFGAPGTAYLTGAYKNQSYRANIVFAGASYKF